MNSIEWGDGLRVGLEDWDDGNTYNEDRCYDQCNIETGFIWTGGSSSSRDKWSSLCGDGYRVRSEQWDDKNTNNGDGCSYQCHVENGFIWTGGS